MEIKGKVKLFVEEKKTKEGRHFKVFSTSFSSKQEDGSYLNKSMEVRFNRDEYPEEKLSKLDPVKVYELEVENGWIGVRSYLKEEKEVRQFYLFIDKATIKSCKDINKVNKADDLPF